VTERRRDDDAEWLLARERGVPGPNVSETTAARYERLQGLIQELPETPGDVAPRAGWQQAVFAAIDAEGDVAVAARPTPDVEPHPRLTRRATLLRWVALAAIAPLAAIAAILFLRPPPGPDPVAFATLGVEVVHGGDAHRSDDPSVGDRMIVRGAVLGAGELRVYDEDGAERARCSVPAADCVIERHESRTKLQLTMQLRAPGVLRPVLFAAPLTGPSAGLDGDVAAAGRVGISVITHEPIRVR